MIEKVLPLSSDVLLLASNLLQHEDENRLPLGWIDPYEKPIRNPSEIPCKKKSARALFGYDSREQLQW